MPNATACPHGDLYQRLAAGRLPETEKEALLKHLEGCDACARRLAALPEPDTLAGLLRHAETLGERGSRETIDHLVDRLSQLRPGSVSAPAAPHILACPACRKTMNVKSELAGQTVRCPHCRQALRVPAVAVATPAAAAPLATRSFAADQARALTTGGHAAVETAEWLGNTVDVLPRSRVDKEVYSFLAPPQAPEELGRLGPYRVLQVLGAGGMGVVFRAEDPQLMRPVALKAMLPALAANDSARQRFLREARAAAAIKHDHIVTIYQVGEDRGVPFLAMEFLEGEPLDARLEREGKLPAAEVLRIGREMAEGLQAAHERGLIHRDIKPANVWLEGKRGRVKVLDFGLARSVGGENQVTQLGVIVGTPAFMAPEQAQGKTVDHRCDLFSLGCVLYRMATGAPAFHGTDLISTIMAVNTQTPPPPHQREATLPPALSQLIMDLLAKEASERPASARIVAEALDRMACEPASAPAQPPIARPVARRKWPIAAGVAVCLLLLGMLGLLASGVFKLKTKDGTIVLEGLPADAQVIVDGDTVRIERRGEGKPIEVHIAPGTHQLAIKAAGFKMETQDVTLQSGDHKPIRIRLEPLTDAANEPASATPLPSRYRNKLGMEFARVPKGKAGLGGGAGRPGDREVEFKHDFYLGVYELTQHEWQAVTGSNPSSISRNGPGKQAVKEVSDADLKRFPAESVSWKMVQLFLEELNKREKEAGWVYRLPTEDEWEYACRGGPNPRRLESAYEWYFDKPTNETPTTAQLNFWGHFKRTCKVGSYKPNKLGLYDMHGNVFEWCHELDQAAPGGPFAVARGGGFWDHSGSGFCRTAHRGLFPPTTINDAIGLRLARVPVGKNQNPVIPRPPEPKRTDKPAFTNSLGMEFALIPKGNAWVGGGGGVPGPEKVEVPYDFYLGKYEVTQGEWQKVIGRNPSRFGAEPGAGVTDPKRLPVEQVSWNDAQEFIKAVNEETKESGWRYRLPTEVEWEYACRGGPLADRGQSAFYFYLDEPTNTLLPGQACNFQERTREVGSYKPNRIGLYDMHGNVQEWCDDARSWCDDAGKPFRAVRGGCYSSDPGSCRATSHIEAGPSHRDCHFGLRLARVRIGK